MKKLLPTSTAGSLPKPSWLAEPEKLWSPWKLENEGLLEGKKTRYVWRCTNSALLASTL